MNAKPIIQVGIALVFLGLTAFIHPGVNLSSRNLLVVIGLVQSGTDDQKTIFLAPRTGGLLVVGGIMLIIVGIKKSSYR